MPSTPDEMFHVTAVANRDSISRHGLDWRRMGAAPGIAGSRAPELPVVHLCEDEFAVTFFCQLARTASDVWAVRVDGLVLEDELHGWFLVRETIGPERLRLACSDVPPGRSPY